MRILHKDDALNHIAQTAYSLSYAIRMNYATYDLVKKFPPLITFISLSIAICGLSFDIFSSKCLSIFILLVSIISIYLSKYDALLETYHNSSKQMVECLKECKKIYYEVKSSNDIEFDLSRINEIYNEFNKVSISEHLLFSNFITKYKFFCCGYDNDWIIQQLNLKYRLKFFCIPIYYLLFFYL